MKEMGLPNHINACITDEAPLPSLHELNFRRVTRNVDLLEE